MNEWHSSAGVFISWCFLCTTCVSLVIVSLFSAFYLDFCVIFSVFMSVNFSPLNCYKSQSHKHIYILANTTYIQYYIALNTVSETNVHKHKPGISNWKRKAIILSSKVTDSQIQRFRSAFFLAIEDVILGLFEILHRHTHTSFAQSQQTRFRAHRLQKNYHFTPISYIRFPARTQVQRLKRRHTSPDAFNFGLWFRRKLRGLTHLGLYAQV